MFANAEKEIQGIPKEINYTDIQFSSQNPGEATPVEFQLMTLKSYPHCIKGVGEKQVSKQFIRSDPNFVNQTNEYVWHTCWVCEPGPQMSQG